MISTVTPWRRRRVGQQVGGGLFPPVDLAGLQEESSFCEQKEAKKLYPFGRAKGSAPGG
jgi:hypothetical protein